MRFSYDYSKCASHHFVEIQTNCNCTLSEFLESWFYFAKTCHGNAAPVFECWGPLGVSNSLGLSQRIWRTKTNCSYITHINSRAVSPLCLSRPLSLTPSHPHLPALSHLSPGHRWFCLQANLNENESLSDVSRKLSNPRRLLWGPGSLFGITAA